MTIAATDPRVRIVIASSAARRLDEARTFLGALPPAGEALIVAPAREAADEIAFSCAAAQRPLFGVRRRSWRELARLLAEDGLSHDGLVPASALALDAIAARVVSEALGGGELTFLAGVAARPGFLGTLRHTIAELRLHAVRAEALADLPRAGADLASLARRFDHALSAAGLADEAHVLRLAARRLDRDGLPGGPAPLVLADVALRTPSEVALAAALLARAPRALVTVPAFDARTRHALAAAGHAAVDLDAGTGTATPLDRVRRFLFAPDVPPAPAGDHDPDLLFFSAPGEARECVEIVRRILEEARRGVRFDRIAVLVRAPELYASHLESGFARGGVPAWFARGSERPDPSGRAFLALLACARQRLSARAFAEYVSLGQVPGARSADAEASSPAGVPWVTADDEALRPRDGGGADERPGTDSSSNRDSDSAGAAAAARAGAPGRSTSRWERLLNEAAVIGGVDRWRRRLAGLARELELRREALHGEDRHDAGAARVDRDLEALADLQAFTARLLPALESLPEHARWADWLDRLDALAGLGLRRPGRVRATLADLRPMRDVPEATLDEVYAVLEPRLRTLPLAAPPSRAGRVFVGTPDHARGRAFDVVFVPGLAERIFPPRGREDPLLPDAARRALGAGLATREERLAEERLLLALALQSACRRVHASYPRMETGAARPRVPSFYALDVERARTGALPDPGRFATAAAAAGDARLAWPAPSAPSAAIDVPEHDLAVLGDLLRRARAGEDVAGRARYLLALDGVLGRSLRARYARWHEGRAWSTADGMCLPSLSAARAVDVDAAALWAAVRERLARHRLGRRPYSPSALQRFAACPYQFFLASILRLSPRDEAAAIERLDPLTRGRLVHDVQAATVRSLIEDGLVPLADHLDAALALVDRHLSVAADRYRDDLAPSVERTWQAEIAAIGAALREWLVRWSAEAIGWVPVHAELGFGLGPGDGRDPASAPAPATVANGFLLHGVVDLVERHATSGLLRLTDHKTGRARVGGTFVVGRGEVLQPALYALALEPALGATVSASRLSYCTTEGGFAIEELPLSPDLRHARRRAIEVLEIVDRAIEDVFLPPAPRHGACESCRYSAVCGPHEERRSRGKRDDRLRDLEVLRGFA